MSSTRLSPSQVIAFGLARNRHRFFSRKFLRHRCRFADIDIRVLKNDAHTLSVDQGDIRVDINLDDFALSVYRDNQLIHADQPGYSIVYIPGEEVIANVKQYPNNARSFGFGEKSRKKIR